MEDNNNKRDYDEFFKPQKDHDAEERTGKAEQPSYYYSYGPYKSGAERPESEAEVTTYTSAASGSTGSVEVSPPRPVRPFGYTDGSGQQTTFNGWQEQKRQRTSFKSVFSAFLAGAVVVGGLMFAADKTNMFTGDVKPLTSSPAASQSNAGGTGSAGSNNGGATTAALDTSRPDNISEIFKQASPAVVKIETKVKARSGRSGSSLFSDPFFRQFFGDSFDNQQPQSGDQLVPGGAGTGFIFEKSGYILTNEHVIDGAEEIYVTVEGYDKPFKATLLGSNYDLDLAALKIEGDKDFPILPIGNSDTVEEGDWVVAIGNPYDFDHTVTVGVLSAKERPISIPDQNGTRNYKHLFQTDAAINPGNSGGPLLNLNGEVIGINTAVSAQAQGIGFAIPTNTVTQVLNNLKNNITIPKEPAPYIGVQLSDISQDWVSELKLENTEGALVASVPRRTPAFTAGIRQYDVITAVNGQKVANTADLKKKIEAAKVGDKLTLTIVRNGAKQDVSVTVGDRNENSDLNN
ncbi:S1C family serine protease [Paenibacillus chartarius]|uniref:S1C family serine protease n=1 Tax=Paenibacillus chartarius TaxID=747481 RepID=A0ABV6DK44_9BACL